MSARARLLRDALASAVALVLPACFIGIDESLMNAAAHDGGTPPPTDGATANDGAGDDGGGGNDGSAGEDVGAGNDASGDPRLVGYWSFDDSTNPGKDYAATPHDGTFKKAAQLGTGIYNQALSLDGTNAMTVAALAGTQFPSVGTLSFWFRFVQHTTTASTWGLFDVQDSARSHFSVAPFIEGDKPIFIEFDNTTETILPNCHFDAIFGAWNHVIVAWTTTAATVYYGVQGGGPLAVAANGGTFIASATWDPRDQEVVFGTSFQGSLDEVRLYNVTFGNGGANDVATIP